MGIPSQTSFLAASDGETCLERSLWRIIAAFFCVAGAGLICLTGGQWLAVPGVLAGMAFVILLARYLELGVYVILAVAIVIEQFKIFGLDNIVTLKIPFYLNFNLITGIGPLVFNPVELLLALMGLVWFMRAVTSREWTLRPIPGGWVVLLFGATLTVFVLFGLSRGGVFKVALWEVRALYYLLAMFFISAQVLRTRRQVEVCLWIIVIGLAIKGIQGCWRFFVDLNGHLGEIPAITGHEDALFMTTAFVFLLACFLLGHRDRLFWVLLMTTPPVFFDVSLDPASYCLWDVVHECIDRCCVHTALGQDTRFEVRHPACGYRCAVQRGILEQYRDHWVADPTGQIGICYRRGGRHLQYLSRHRKLQS